VPDRIPGLRVVVVVGKTKNRRAVARLVVGVVGGAACGPLARVARRSRQRAQRDSVQYSCKTKLRADGQAEVHVSSGEESEAVTKEVEESEDEFVTERKEPLPLPKWEGGIISYQVNALRLLRQSR
jgi:hypothetical protein